MDQLDVAKAALAQTGTRSTITAFDDGSEEGLYLGLLYEPLRDFLLAEGDYDFSMVAAVPTASSGFVFPWSHAYAYPADALRIRQLVPTSFDPYDPRPVEWTITGTGGTKKIFTGQDSALVFYTKAVVEALWEPLFTEAFIRLLSSALLYALRNNVAPSKERLSEAMSFAGIASLRDE
jgi:hypothetical protein